MACIYGKVKQFSKDIILTWKEKGIDKESAIVKGTHEFREICKGLSLDEVKYLGSTQGYDIYVLYGDTLYAVKPMPKQFSKSKDEVRVSVRYDEGGDPYYELEDELDGARKINSEDIEMVITALTLIGYKFSSVHGNYKDAKEVMKDLDKTGVDVFGRR